MNPKIATRRVSLLILLFALCAVTALAQTTSFTYQGRLSDGGTPATGNYDLQFALWDSNSGGTQIGATQTISTVAVSAGIFTVQLDFGAGVFPGANRFLEIGTRLSGGGAFTILSPRQPISSTPYAIRSLNASTADAVIVNGVPGGSGNYVQNTTSPQAASNFNISGDGTAGGTLSANTVNATTQYNLGGLRMLSAGGTRNVFAGLNSGAITTGTDNAFFGALSGQVNTTGLFNSFFGSTAGQHNTTGNYNSFFGTETGLSNTTGSYNSFFGIDAGLNNTTGFENSFFGVIAGYSNTEGHKNSFFGQNAGGNNTTGSDNTFFGYDAGVFNGTGNYNAFFGNFAGYSNSGSGVTGVGEFAGFNNHGASSNTLLGYFADVDGTINPTNATAVGANALVGQSNSLVLGSVAGVNGATSSVSVGIGTTTPQATLHVKGSTRLEAGGSGGTVQFLTPNGETGMIIVGTNRADVRFDGSTLKLVAGLGAGAQPSTNGVAVSTSGRVGVGTTSPTAALEVKGNSAGVTAFRVTNSSGFPGLVVKDDLTVTIGQLSASASSTHVCLDGNSILSFCTSSLRYKDHVTRYSGGLDLISRLRPISFTWKGNGLRDFGLGAEDVAKVEPRLVTLNNEGQIQGVKYDQLNVVLINAIKQQQEQIETLRAQNDALSARLRSVEKIVRKSSARRRR